MFRNKVSILAIDDEMSVLRLFKNTLESHGYRVFTATDGRAGLDIFSQETPDLVILDITMPGLDGFSVCRHIREFSQVPIIMVTARGAEDDKIMGFECGADDYVTKPFSIREFVARVKSVLHRSQLVGLAVPQPIFNRGNLEIDFEKRSVTYAKNIVNLTPTEYNLLQELVVNRGRVLTYSYLLQKIWGPEYLNETEYLYVFIGRLRSKLHFDTQDQQYIITLPGIGYQFREITPINT
jgi:two-component system alkaline phosphatase synthesis response regulator PhoP